MRRIAPRWRSGSTGESERGAVAIFVLLLLVALIGLGAYVIDIGALFEERRDLQNGADAAVLAVATDCANAGICTSAGAQPEAERIASLNANDGQATVNDADIVFDNANNTVTVTVHTLDASDGNGEIDYVLGPVIGNDSSAVSASATSSWGAPSTAAVIPIIISSCEWADITANGTIFDVSTIIYLHGAASSPPPCSFGPGHDIAGCVDPGDTDCDGNRNEGGFGYLDAVDCTATVLDNDFVLGEPGNGNPGSMGCTPSDLLDQTLLIPIFDDIPANGNPCAAPGGQPCYHVYGFGAFHVTGFNLSGGQWKTPPAPCNGAQRCIEGYFTEFVTLADFTTGGNPPNLGVFVVGLTG